MEKRCVQVIMTTFSFLEQRVIIRFLLLRGVTPIDIHRQLSVSWMRRMCVRACCSSKKSERLVTPNRNIFGLVTCRSDNMSKRMVAVVLKDSRLNVKDIANKLLPALRGKRPENSALVTKTMSQSNGRSRRRSFFVKTTLNCYLITILTWPDS